jgi:hypothetical protein
MWQMTSALIEDRLSTLRAEADHQRLIGVARRARKAAREQRVRIPTQRAAEARLVRLPQETTEPERSAPAGRRAA